MKKLVITNADNSKMTVDLVRYFKFKSDCFLIYTMGEIDEKNYLKLYLMRIMEELGFPVVQTIKNDADWANMQIIVKKVLKELKKGKKKSFEDLDYKEIDGIKVVNPRFFKLDHNLVALLSSDYSFGNDALNEIYDNKSYTMSMQQELEPIDQTMLRENMMSSTENVFDDNHQSVDNSVRPVSPLPDYSLDVDEIDDSNKYEDNFTPNVLKFDSESENNYSPNVITPIMEENQDNIVNSNVQDNTIDYKNLYEALEKDNASTNELLNAVMSELSKYKKKYGELDINS